MSDDDGSNGFGLILILYIAVQLVVVFMALFTYMSRHP